MASFATLKALGDYYSIMRTCLEIRKQEIRALNWDIALTPEAAKAYRGDREAMRDFGERRAKAKRFFSKPDPNYFDFASWLYACMEQVFVYDALSLYLCPKKGRGLGRGLLGSDLDCLWAIDGSSIRPLMGLHGEMPAPPAPAYQQYEFGVPRADLAAMIDDRDLEGAEVGRLRQQLRGDQLIYLPYVPRMDSPYGFSLVEQAIIPIMTGLRKQAMQLDFFDENTVPRAYISPGDTNMTPTQIRELMDALNATAGDMGYFFKVVVLPPGSKVMPQKEMEIVDQADEWIATEVCMVASVNPMELGILPKIATTASPFAAREVAQASRSIHERTATKPTLEFITAIPDFILQQVCHQEDMRFVFDGMDDESDLAAQNDMDIKDVQSGIKSIDEIRDSRGLVPWGLPETTGPIVITQMGPLPLEDAAQLAQAQAQEARAAGGTGAHAAADGATGKRNGKTIPLGTSGRGRMNGPVTQRQARRGGALAPAHATAEGAPGHSGGKAAAVTAELDALGRHLRKGRDIATWQARHLPVHVLASVADDLSKGLSTDEAVGLAKTVILSATEYAWADGEVVSGPKAQGGGGTPPSQQQQQQAQALAQQYATRIRAAFTAAMNAAAKLIAAWAAGTLTVTVAVLIGMIANEIRKRLARVLAALWRKAWLLGQQAAEAATGGKVGKQAAKEALAAFLATVGEDLAGLISRTRMKALQDRLTELIRSGGDPQQISEETERTLGVLWRADLIAVTEAMRALNAAMLATYQALGVAYKVWRLGSNPNHCQVCIDNQAQGPVPVSGLFKSGLPSPPQHPRCGCRCLPFVPPKPATATKGSDSAVLTRRVPLNGEVTWETATEPELNPAGSGAPLYPHRADGTQEVAGDIPGGVPGMTAGGEPPRWDGTEPGPGDRWIEGGDDASQGGQRGLGHPGTYWPAPYMDGYWPQGGHGTQQAPASSPGGGGPRGRAPNSVGKCANAAEVLAEAPKAKARAVYDQMLTNYPPDSIAWIKTVKWRGPAEIPLDDIDWDSENAWAAHHEMAKVEHFMHQLTAREQVNPAVGIIRPGEHHVRIVDGHHRSLACKHLGWPSRMYVGLVTDDATAHAALETHLYQVHQGADPANKTFTAGAGVSPDGVHGLVPFNLLGQGPSLPKDAVSYGPATSPYRECGNCSMFVPGGRCTLVEGEIDATAVCDRWVPETAGDAVTLRPAPLRPKQAVKGADSSEPHVAGLMVRAADTGRVLMLQRAITEDDPAAGLWEPAGGHAEPGETLLQAALREWSEEVGKHPPQGSLTGSWTSSDGIYRGYVLTIPSEDTLDIFEDRDQVINPDGDPHGDVVEALAWWAPDQFRDNPSLRPEMQRDLPQVLAALDGITKSGGNAETLREYWTHEAHPGPTRFEFADQIKWGTPGDFMKCVALVKEHAHMDDEQAKGYCNLLHYRALGYWPAQHARMA